VPAGSLDRLKSTARADSVPREAHEEAEELLAGLKPLPPAKPPPVVRCEHAVVPVPVLPRRWHEVSRMIMKSRGGDLLYAATPGGGATFTASFPRSA
jgi:hypothetical protein